ncbi:hypothetical protein H7347_06950 [Corynebacterium sp. zg-331]|uniref:hypothetical protein n=1 Tax=unclassified Corynebacterium TaxID=2624378 RepID=UPI00128B26D2|nr:MULTISPECIES: hypothetical protein [unclassified Corynebacterium]MBC3186310.1 hypothetical protein [Corynebacterium sp. zg-331]MPV52798.1 hypothetical protein [Corynebacterium sp. zg331]
MAPQEISFEEFEDFFDGRDGEGVATLTVGDCALNGHPLLIEYLAARIERILESDRGFDWLEFGTGKPDAPYRSVLVTSSTPITIQWPPGFEPFVQPNELVEKLQGTDTK